MSERAKRRVREVTYSIFVGHLAFEVTKRMLYDLFKPFGEIHDVSIQKCQQSMDKQPSFTYGFVRFKEKEAAEKAVLRMNDWPVKGLNIRVEISDRTLQNGRDDVQLSYAPVNAKQDLENLVKLMNVMTEVARTTEADHGDEQLSPEDLLVELSEMPITASVASISQPASRSPDRDIFNFSEP